MSFLLIVLGLILLVKSADLFVDGCSNVARALGIPSLIVGLTIVSFGTSAPEVAISITAALKGANDIAISNAVGSNICNMLLVLGVCGLFGNLVTKKKVITRDFIYAIFAAIILVMISLTSFENGASHITRTSGNLLMCFLIIYVYALIEDVLNSTKSKKDSKEKFKPVSLFYITLGCAGIVYGGDLVVKNAEILANFIGISRSVVTLSLVDIGTSLPELVTSIVAVKKGETDLAIGNVVGSNIFNIFFVLGLSCSIRPIMFGLDAVVDIIIMAIVSITVYILVLRQRNISKKEGFFLLSMYILYMIYIFVR